MSNYQLYLEKARYQSPNNEQLLNEALETFFESDPFGNKEADAVAFLGLVTTIATIGGVALMPIVFTMALAMAGMKKVFNEMQFKSNNIENLKLSKNEKEAIKNNTPNVLKILKENNYKIKQEDLKKIKENLESIK